MRSAYWSNVVACSNRSLGITGMLAILQAWSAGILYQPKRSGRQRGAEPADQADRHDRPDRRCPRARPAPDRAGLRRDAHRRGRRVPAERERGRAGRGARPGRGRRPGRDQAELPYPQRDLVSDDRRRDDRPLHRANRGRDRRRGRVRDPDRTSRVPWRGGGRPPGQRESERRRFAVKLLLSILDDRSAGRVADALVSKRCGVTRIYTVGGFLKRGNATLLVGVDDDQVDEAIALMRE